MEERQGRPLHTEQLAQLNIPGGHSEPAPARLVLEGNTPGEGGELLVGLFYSGKLRLRLGLAVLQVGQLSS